MATRREMLAGLAAAALLPRRSWAAVGSPVAVSAAMRRDGQHVLVGLDSVGTLTFAVALPARGHAAAAHPTEAEVVAIARRPGRFARVIDCTSGQILKSLNTPEGRHFCGHAAFDTNGRYLYTTENAYEDGEGRIGVWDRARGYTRVGEFASGGIGPHEIIRLPNADLAVANGGIRTHPASGRTKLNLDTMRSNLTILSTSGEIREQAHVPEEMRLNSLRHIAALPDGRIVCGFQWQGDIYDAPSLVAGHGGGAFLRFAEMPETTLRGLDGYIGSVCRLGQHGYAVSSPRGGQVLAIGTDGVTDARFAVDDACGLAPTAFGHALMTDGHGRVFALQTDRLDQLAQHDLAFDNHLIALAD